MGYSYVKKRLSQKTCEMNQNVSEKKKKWKAQYAHKRYRNLSGEEKEKKCQYGCERYKFFLEE